MSGVATGRKVHRMLRAKRGWMIWPRCNTRSVKWPGLTYDAKRVTCEKCKKIL